LSGLLESVALPGAADWVTPLLAAVALVSAGLTTAAGAGGGLLLLAAMTLFLPVGSVIPLHGVVQFGATSGRALLLWRHVRLPLVLAFSLGGVIGALAGSQVLVRLPESVLQLVLGAFIIVLAWLPLPRLRRVAGPGTAVAGAVTTALTLFVGATGPLVSAALHALNLDRLVHVGTFGACMVVQHGLKIAVFGFAGFAFAPYGPFLALMLASVLLGNLLGRVALARLDDRRFHRLLAVVLTLLALRLLYTGLAGLAD